MKYNLSAKSYQLIFLVLLKKYYKNNLPTRNFNEIKKKIKKYYREMVERTPGIGGNSLESNLVAGCFFFAMAKADEEMTPELMNDIIDRSIQSNLMQKAHERQKKKGTLFSDKVQNQKVLESHSRKIISYWGLLKNSNSVKVIQKYHVKDIMKICKKVVKEHDKISLYGKTAACIVC